MIKSVCYRVDNGLVVAIRDDKHVWSIKETDGKIFKVCNLDLSAQCLEDIDLKGLTISDEPETDCLIVDNTSNPTCVERCVSVAP